LDVRFAARFNEPAEMKSSSGVHYIALDHVRALAAFMVVAWHFTHETVGFPVPFDYTPTAFPLALLDEGHTGVALFMTLSGYLFAKLLDGKSIIYSAFIWNRVLRLLPLLVVVILLVGVKTYVTGESMSEYAQTVATGVLYPGLPNGGWSITVEFHFYLLLPLFLWLVRKSRFLPLLLIVAAMALRLAIHHRLGQVQSLAYWTIVGRVDQVVLGMLAYHFRSALAKRHDLAAIVLIAFALLYWWFDRAGGMINLGSYPSRSLLWVVMPTIEGFAYAVGIAWYDNSFVHATGAVSRFIGRIGELSYSIYLLHFFLVFRVARLVHERIMDISSFPLACVWAALFMVLMLIPAEISYRFIEAPFLKLRKRYVITPERGQHEPDKAEQSSPGLADLVPTP
jgi:peptidoglycan/LPS O-acetylase OafA/YrhL